VLPEHHTPVVSLQLDAITVNPKFRDPNGEIRPKAAADL
jgi:hypothetical protein